MPTLPPWARVDFLCASCLTWFTRHHLGGGRGLPAIRALDEFVEAKVETRQ